MKIRILPIMIVILMLFSTINVIGVDSDDDNNLNLCEENYQISFSKASIETKGEYVSLNLYEATTNLISAGKPILPVYIKTFIFPCGTKIKNVECIISDVASEVISGKIQPSPKPLPKISIDLPSQNNAEQTIVDDKLIAEEDEGVYSSSELYPDNWYTYKTYSGLIDDQDSIILKVTVYPVRYSPLENTIHSIDSIYIQVAYEETSIDGPSAGPYDLLIITPNRFKLWILPLYFHKTRMGVSTKIQSVESIYEDFEGRDKPEQIKYFIKYAKEEWGIKYVLLFGGLKTHLDAKDRDNRNEGSTAWYVPVRYVQPDRYFNGHISDLYYADIYKNDGTEFEDWDSNSNDIFGEDDEIIDLYPDVYYGRLPCRNILEVRTVVNKIIKYEKPSIFGKPWMEKMIAIGGQTFQFFEGIPDGEWLCDLSIEDMGDMITEVVKVYSSNNDTGGPVPVPKDIVDEYSKGAGFVLFQGHGSAHSWDTHWADEPGTEAWAGPFTNYNMPGLTNGRKLPIVVVGGCHNGIFNTTLIKSINDPPNLDESMYHTYGLPIMNCFSWKLVLKSRGGAIASTGCTDYGLGSSHPYYLSGALESNFFYEIGKEENPATTVGAAHSGSIIKYMDDFDISADYSSNVYCITEYQLFADPSLKIGGY